MTFKKAIANTVSSSCFIESTDGQLCFHYYKNKFFFNDGKTFEYESINTEDFLEYMKKEYVIKYGIREIDYNKLIQLHDKLEAGEFNPETESFLDVISDNFSYDKEIIESIVSENSDKIIYHDEVLSTCIIKYMFEEHSTKAKLSNLIYLLSFPLLYFLSMLIMYNFVIGNMISIVCIYILAFGLCCVNDSYNINIGNVNFKKFFFTFIPLLASSYFMMFNFNIHISIILLIISFILFLRHRSNVLRSLTKFFRLFNLECYK